MKIFVEDHKSGEVLFTISNGEFTGSKGDTLVISGKGLYEVTDVQHVFSWSSGPYNNQKYDSISQVSMIVKVKGPK